jgi:hypothetical protein
MQNITFIPMCLYAEKELQIVCRHSECNILETVKKMNKPIFKAKHKNEEPGIKVETQNSPFFRIRSK